MAPRPLKFGLEKSSVLQVGSVKFFLQGQLTEGTEDMNSTATTAADRNIERVQEHNDLLELNNEELLAEIERTDAVARNLSKGGIRREERAKAMRNMRRGAAARIIAKNRGLAI